MNIAIGGDHAGLEYKEQLISFLKLEGFTVNDYGPFTNASCDYPDFAHAVASNVANHQNSFGILICGSGNGVAMTANKHRGIRAALCWNAEVAQLARQHNDANIICMPARFVTYESVLQMTEVFLATAFEGGRHQRRVDKIDLA
ncbi:MAG: ribose 5-phosphate isomerase B [Bacteroidetes bacterium]|nr:ribose 5-phosphate isomerase B [Bacteroidota bacterium]